MAKDDLFVSLDETLIKNALGRVAHVLRPFPKDVEPSKIEESLGRLAAKNLINLRGREPNLTRAGVEAAEKLASAAEKPARSKS